MSRDILDLPAPAADARVRYGPEAPQFGDLRFPAGEGPHPVVVVVHGGFWRARHDLTHIGHVCGALAGAGVATWSIEYRRIGDPGGGWVGTFHDVAAAVDHVRVLAESYPLDLRRVVALGHSAGGHLALWLAGRHRIPDGNPLFSPDPLPLRGVVSLAGVADLRRAWELRLSDGVVEEFLEGSPSEHPERYTVASPIESLPLGMPQALIHGTADEDVPYEISERYHAAAVAARDPVELITLPGAGHFELIDPRSREWRGIEATVLRLLA